MSYANACATCDHKRYPDGGWCYMFREAPRTICLKHSTLRGDINIFSLLGKTAKLYQMKAEQPP